MESEGAEWFGIQFELANKNQTKESFKHISHGPRGKNVDMFILYTCALEISSWVQYDHMVQLPSLSMSFSASNAKYKLK